MREPGCHRFEMGDGMTREEIRQAEIAVQGFELSPWFKQTEPPVRNGRYQVKDWVGNIVYLEWYFDHWRDAKYDHVPSRKIHAWRGVVQA